MESTEAEIRAAAKSCLAEGRADVVIGYEDATVPLRTRPCFVRKPDDTDRLVWNAFCTNNLAVYLAEMFRKPAHPRRDDPPSPNVAVVAKGCDALSLINLVREHQVPRENLIIIGVPCQGKVDPDKASAAAGGLVIACEGVTDDTVCVTVRGGAAKDLALDDVIADACLECEHAAAEGADITVAGEARKPSQERFSKAKAFEALSRTERWQRFQDEISRCVRCYACRQACPNCFCRECFAEQGKPRWVALGTHLSDVMAYHIGRIFHQAGRCVECDACARACPMDIDLRTFTQKLAKDVKELLDYEPGFSVEEALPLCTYSEDDPRDMATEP